MEQDNKLIRSVVETAKTGNKAALQQLYTVSVDRVYALLLRILPNDKDAENLTREILINSLHTVSKIQDDDIYSLWLTQNVIRTVLNKVENNELKINRKGLTIVEEPDEQRSGKRFVGNVALEESIHALPLNERIAFVLNELGGCSVMDIAGILNISYEDANDLLNVAKGLVIVDFNKRAGNTEEDFEYAEKFFRTKFVSLQKKINPANDLWQSVKTALDELRIKNTTEIEVKGVVRHFGDDSGREVKVVDKEEMKKKLEQKRILEEAKARVRSGSDNADKKPPLVKIMVGVIIFLLVLLIVFIMM
ncbi:MAG: sigma-70 family RNA polymerase sigma factor [Ignavibacteriales bacterium]|nr:MAG: sigma-70 family RNA polymerase sigma factor [Ignavibacteriales bacterium]